MKLRHRNRKMLVMLVTALFFFSLFPGYGFAVEPLDSPEQIEATSDTPGTQPGQGGPDGITGGDPQGDPGENQGNPDDDPQEDPGDNQGTLGDDPQEDPGDNSGTPDKNPQEYPGDNPVTPGEDPQGAPADNPGDNPEGTPGDGQEEQLTQQMPVIPEKVTLTINHVLVWDDGSEELLGTSTLQDQNLGDTVNGRDYQLQGEAVSFLRSIPEVLVLGTQDNVITLLYAPVIPVEKVSLTINHKVVLEDGSEKLFETTTLQDLNPGDTVKGSDYQLQEEGLFFLGSEPEELVLESGENFITILYSFPIVAPENPDHLDGPQEISAPELYYPMAPRMMKGFNLMSLPGLQGSVDENGNITDPDTPGYISLNKEEEKVEGTDNQWKITLTIHGVPKTETNDIVLVIDRSGSMRDDNRMAAAKEAAKEFIDTLLPDGNTYNRIALVSFAGDVITHAGFTDSTGRNTLLSYLDGGNNSGTIRPNGGTFTQAGLRQAKILLADSAADNKIIVLLSDGVPTYSYKIDNPDEYLEFWREWFFVDLFRTNESVLENAFVYDETVGNGSDDHAWYDWFKYYSHGNSAISESKFAKAAGQTIYTIALEAGSEGNRVLNGIASPGKAYTASPADLSDIFDSIASSILPAATEATITDPMGYWFSIPGIDETNYESLIEVNHGTIQYDTESETIFWYLEAITTGPYTMSYIVEIDPSAPSGTHDTNGDTPIHYTNIYGDPAEKPFPIPAVTVTGANAILFYHPNGGEGTMDPRTAPIGMTFNLDPNAFTRDGYTFQGWSITQDGAVEYVDKAEFTMPAGGATLYAVWQARTDIEYTVNYLEQGTDKSLAEAKVVENQTFGSQVTEEAIDIEGYNKVEPISVTITLDKVEGNVITFYYTARTDIEYTVNYLEQGTDKPLAEAKVVGGQTFGSQVTEEAIDIEGYNKVDPTTVTITLAVSGNVITFYYTARTDIEYTVNYLEQGTDKPLAEAKVVGGQTFGSQVTEEAIDIEGYNKVDPTTVTITLAVSGNVINFYYTARTDISYTVNYLEQGTDRPLAEAKVVENQTFGSQVTEEAIDIEGYNKVEPTTVTITLAVSGNVINFYYTARTDIEYTVNYLEQGTDRPLAEAKVVENQTFGSQVTEEAIDIEGYNKVEPTTVTITLAVSGNVINFYYTARTDIEYTVNYLEQGTDRPLAEAKVVENQTFGSQVTEEAIDIEGYNKVDPTTVTITLAVSGNVINFYYTARTDISYTVNYLEQGTDRPLAEAKVVENQTFGSQVTEEAIDIEGYNKVEPISITITLDKVEGNVITFYYTARTDIEYTVNYLEQGTDKPLAEAKVVGGQTFGSQVTEEAIDIEGYNKVDPTTVTITLAVSGNVINFYYTARTDISYTVNYLEQGTDRPLAEAKVVENQTFGSQVTEEAIDIEGYNKVDPTTVTITLAVSGNVINFYYTARTDISYTVNYLEQGTDRPLAEAKVVENQTFGSQVTEEAIDIEGYNKVEPTTVTITLAVSGNVINFYYTARTDIEYTVNYLEQGTDRPLAEAKVVENQTFGSQVTEEAIDIEGYNKVEPTTVTITLAVSGNVINFYYTARTDIEYTVNYLEQGTDRPLAEAKVVENQTFGSQVTEEAIDIEGYNKVEPTTVTITLAVSGNVINFYYTARTDIEYTVNYLEQGTDRPLAEAKVVENQTFGSQVTEEAIDIEGYNKVEPTTVTITLAVSGNVINFYYTARTDIEYTVNYLEQGTDKSLAEAKVVENQTFGSQVTEEAIDIEGYNKVEPISVTITLDKVEGNVITFYYTARTDIEYTVNYLEQGTDKPLAEAKVVGGQTFGSQVTEEAIDIEGYNKVDPTTVTITLAVSGNVITFYYTARTDIEYTVNYLEQGTDKPLAEAKVVGGQTFGSQVTEEAIDIEGYNKVDPTTVTITLAVSGNVINFYYTARTDISYTVNYLEQGTDRPLAEAKVVENQTFGSQVTEEAIDIEGYNKVEPTTVTITLAVSGNVINFYYTARTDIEYTVNYLEQGTDRPLAEAKVVENQTFGSQVTEEAIDIEGYNKVEPTTVTITLAVSGNVINFYYTARTDIEYTVNYLEQGTDKSLAEAKVVENQTFGSQVTEEAIDIEGYNKVEPISVTITLDKVEGNVINFYYTARTDIEYTVNYLEQGTDKPLAEAKVVENQTFGSQVTEEAIDIEGYNKVDPTTVTITLDKVEGNVINFYYTARTDIEYTVNYLEQGTDKPLAEAKVVENQTFGSQVTEEAIDIEGYNKVDPTTVTITLAVSGNVINFYYVKDSEPHFNVYYHANYEGGSAPSDPNTYLEGDWVVVAGEINREGFAFVSWNTEADGSGIHYMPGQEFEMPAEDVNLYAQWAQAVNDNYSTKRNTRLAVAAPGVLNNDTFVPSVCFLSWNTDPQHGKLTFNDDGSFTYEPDSGFVGTDSFFYAIGFEGPVLEMLSNLEGNNGDNNTVENPDDPDDPLIAKVTITVTGGGGGGGGGGSTEEIVVEPEEPLVPLNKEDHFAYIAGYPDNTVRPEGNVTREEVAAVFYRLLDETYRDSVKTDVNNFLDVEADRWSNIQISTLAAIGVITGYPDGTFRPSNSITRAELATIASKFDKLSPFVADNFSDITGHWANQYINSAAQKGWVKGYEDGTFRPEQPITRAEFVTLVNNVLGRKVLKENILPDAKTFPDLSPNAWYYEAMMEAINGHYYERENPDDYEVWTELYETHIDL